MTAHCELCGHSDPRDLRARYDESHALHWYCNDCMFCLPWSWPEDPWQVSARKDQLEDEDFGGYR